MSATFPEKLRDGKIIKFFLDKESNWGYIILKSFLWSRTDE